MIVPAGATQDRPGPGAGAPPPASRPRRLRERTRTTTRMKERERERESAEGKMAMRAEGSVRGSLHSAAGRRGGMGGGGEESFAGGGRKYETGEQRRNMSRAQLAEPLDALEKWYGRRQAGRCCRCRRGPPGLKAAAAVPGGGEAGTEQHAPSARAGAPAARLRPQTPDVVIFS
ncbi:unnamed protein product [Prorocentrum cordatum]|uniref:Uncharacterized protein n=1 Tax=Prorocentrum cordatum TaxID=2364126 RepID=A0ABN9PTT3_9DINO|nr:unnamed protein product [Polarella glacialis]